MNGTKKMVEEYVLGNEYTWEEMQFDSDMRSRISIEELLNNNIKYVEECGREEVVGELYDFVMRFSEPKLEKSLNINKEIGAIIYKTNKDIKIHKVVVGDENSVSYTNLEEFSKIPDNVKSIVLFHTHPKGVMSIEDEGCLVRSQTIMDALLLRRIPVYMVISDKKKTSWHKSNFGFDFEKSNYRKELIRLGFLK